ncbi:MAG: hypothetical protein KAS16_00960, partial [Thermoplasmata archaeon]|nr:hypothetical protein [Thermoplasmata archaeon]
ILQASAADAATTVESMEYSFDGFVTAGIPMVVDVYDVPAGTTSFTADLELHNYALGIYTISVRATDANSNQEIAPYVNADLTVSDTTAPLSTYTAPTPIDLKTSVTGSTETIRIDAHDFLEFAVSGGSANLWTNTDAAGWVDAGAMTADGSAAGSWHNYYTATITSAVPASIQYYVAATDGTNAANSATQTLNFADAALGPSFPAEVKGFANLYNGDHVAGYLPIAQVGALVTMQTYNATGVLITLGPVATDAIGRYLFTVQPDEYDVGGTVWVNYTNGAYLDFQVGVFAVDGAEVWANGTFGVPYDMHVDWIPFWDGNLPAPVSGSNTYFPGQAFYVNITVYDAYGNIAPGYYCWMEIDTNESSLLQDLWLGGVAPTAIEFDGIGGATTDGYYNNTVQLYTAGVWAIFVNATIDGAGTPATNLTWFGGANPTNPQLDPAGNVTNITHVQIAAGGFYWTPIADWNLVSVPMNVSVALLTGGNFLASTACQQVEDAAVFAGAGIGTTTIIMAQQILNQYPAQYNTFEYGVGGTDFTLGIDYAYWLFVDVDLTADGVYIQADELEVDDTIEIDAAGLNTVTLGTSWTMVNPSASWGNSSAWLGGAAVHIDLRGNTGLWSTGAGQLYTGGGWNGGANIAWYGNPATPLYPAAYTGYAEDPGSWVSTGTVIADSAVWAPAVAGGLWTAKSYEPAFYGQTDPGMGSANDADLLSYANGFIVWSTGGDITYYIDYDWALPGTDVPAF